MARARSPNRDKAKIMYLESNGEKRLKDIAEDLGLKDSQIRKWKSQDKWDQELKAALPKKEQKKGNFTNKEVTKKKEKPSFQEVIEESDIESADLTEMQQLFCLYYIKSFNATMSPIKAGYAKDSAHVEGHRLLRNAKVAVEIRRLKGSMRQEVFIDAMDVLNKYIKIAFADITDYVTFGQKEIQVMGSFGPVEDDKGNPVMKIVNYVDFNESNMVDGTIISEAKQGKDGVSIKLADKMKALDKLSLYFDLFPDKFKRKIEEEKLAMAKRKAGDDDKELHDDGFIEVLGDTTQEVWDDYEKE